MALDIFITPKPCETIFSILTRAHILSGSLSPLTSLRNLTGHRGYKPLSSLPSNISNICNSLHLEASPEQLINEHTLFPFYRPFLPEGRHNFVVQGILNGGATKSRVGLLKSHCGAADQLAYCYECVRDDTFKFGFPYWHREHMLVGMEICYIHKIPLTKIATENNKFGARCLQLPGERRSPNVWSETQFKQLCFIAEQLSAIVNKQNKILIESKSYHSLLVENNLVTQFNHFRMKNLQVLIDDWLRPLAGVPPFDKLFKALSVERNWVANLIAGKEGMHHPLKHIILWGALNIDFESVINSLQKVEQLNLSLKAKMRQEITKEALHAALSTWGSATASARFLNCSTQTVLALMEKFKFKTKRKPKKLNHETIERVLELSSKGLSTAKIATELRLSISTINRIERANS